MLCSDEGKAAGAEEEDSGKDEVGGDDEGGEGNRAEDCIIRCKSDAAI